MKSPPARLQSSDKKPTSDKAGETSVLSVLGVLESLTLAVLLALVFRGFVVEAFVIPTGSMAETLLGTHTEIICHNCQELYSTGLPQRGPTDIRGWRKLVSKSYCPNCGALVSGPLALQQGQAPGDRVLVLKPMYFLSRYKGLEWLAPKRWDVAVFLYPGNGRENYIKRITGLPGESIEIIDGDIYIDGQVTHKPPSIQEELWIPVYQNDYQGPRKNSAGPAWQEVNGRLERLSQGRVLRLKAKGSERTLVYKGVNDSKLAYNALHSSLSKDRSVMVSDLRLSFDVIGRDTGRDSEVTAVLGKAGRQFRLRMKFLDDQAVIELQSRYVTQTGQGRTYWKTMPDADGSQLRRTLVSIGLGKAVHLQLQNVDYRLSVWVDGKEIMATSKNSYKPGPASQVRDLAQNRSSKPYVAIGAKDVEVDLLHIKLDRDVYYTSSGKISIQPKERPQADAVSAKIDGDPGHACAEPFQLPLKNHPGPGYFLMGDNSSSSFDSRRWSVKHSGLGEDYVRGTVPRSHMIGQAFSGYWIPALHPKRQLIPRASKVRFIR